MTLQEFLEKLSQAGFNFDVDTDFEGQLILYTGLYVKGDDLVPYSEDENA